MRASETPAALASALVVVPWKPFSEKTLSAARMMASRRSSAGSLVVRCLVGIGWRGVSIRLQMSQQGFFGDRGWEAWERCRGYAANEVLRAYPRAPPPGKHGTDRTDGTDGTYAA